MVEGEGPGGTTRWRAPKATWLFQARQWEALQARMTCADELEAASKAVLRLAAHHPRAVQSWHPILALPEELAMAICQSDVTGERDVCLHAAGGLRLRDGRARCGIEVAARRQVGPQRLRRRDGCASCSG